MKTTYTIYSHKTIRLKNHDPIRRKKTQRHYVITHRDRINELSRLRYLNPINKAKKSIRAKKYYEKNKERILEAGRQYYKENTEKVLKQKEEYRNRPEVKARIKLYYLNHKHSNS